MATVAKLLDLAKAHSQIDTDSALGKRLGRSRQTISQWRSGVSFPDDDQVMHLVRLAHEDAGLWLVAIQAARSSGAPGQAWTALARRLGVAAAVCVALVLPQVRAAVSDFAINANTADYVILAGLAAWILARSQAFTRHSRKLKAV